MKKETLRSFLILLLTVLSVSMVVVGCDDSDSDDSSRSAVVQSDWYPTEQFSTSSCNWWHGLTQSQRNYQLILEALYSVDRNIWGQNSRLPCAWSSYLKGGCALMGNWDYSENWSCNGCGGTCKNFARELVERASGEASHLRSGYDFRQDFLHRAGDDVRKYAQPGELVQWDGKNSAGKQVLHTAIIISNFGDGRLEVVHSNWDPPNKGKISKSVVDMRSGYLKGVSVRSYLIGSRGCN